MHTKNSSIQKRNKYAILIVVAGVVIIIFAGFVIPLVNTFWGYEKFPVPVPSNWQLIRNEGSIPKLCFGSGSECGHIIHTYTAIETDYEILDDLEKEAEKNGWSFSHESNGGRADAVVKNANGVADIFINGKTVEIDYTKL